MVLAISLESRKPRVGLRSTLRWGQWDRTVRLVADHEIAITDTKSESL